MNDVINKLSSKESGIMLINDLDYLCVRCPNNLGDKCRSNDKVIDLDKKTVYRFNLKYNEVYLFKDIIEKIYKNYNEGDFKFICNECEWYKSGVCNTDIIKLQKSKWLKVRDK